MGDDFVEGGRDFVEGGSAATAAAAAAAAAAAKGVRCSNWVVKQPAVSALEITPLSALMCAAKCLAAATPRVRLRS